MCEFSLETTAPVTLVCSTDACCLFYLFYCSQSLSAPAPAPGSQLTPAEHEGLCASLNTGISQLQTRAINKLILGARGSGRRRGLCKTSLPASELDLHKVASSEKASDIEYAQNELDLIFFFILNVEGEGESHMQEAKKHRWRIVGGSCCLLSQECNELQMMSHLKMCLQCS